MPPWSRPTRRTLTALALTFALLAGGLLLFTTVVSLNEPTLSVPPASAALRAPLPPAHPPAGLRFSVVPTASSRGALEALIVAGGSWWRQRQPVQVAILIDHPKGTLLFDTGLGRQVDAQFAVNTWLDRQFFAYGDVHPAVDQLAAAGWPASRIRMVLPSHMHWDHVSGLPDFPDAEVWVSAAERAGAEHGAPPGFLRSQFAGVRHWRELRFDGGPWLDFPASHDVFGDGSVVLVPLAGHTAGQVGLCLSLPSGQRYLFTGDVTWTREGIERAADRSWLLRRLVHVDHDARENQQAIVHLHQLMRAHPELTLVPAHDEHLIATLPRFPQFGQ
jgi:glyoxylase-like metal-dependent hydrolase (beta-lactamase superfamily II)